MQELIMIIDYVDIMEIVIPVTVITAAWYAKEHPI